MSLTQQYQRTIQNIQVGDIQPDGSIPTLQISAYDHFSGKYLVIAQLGNMNREFFSHAVFDGYKKYLHIQPFNRRSKKGFESAIQSVTQAQIELCVTDCKKWIKEQEGK